jgi:DNA-binding NarL/FixJ family response regulator
MLEFVGCPVPYAEAVGAEAERRSLPAVLQQAERRCVLVMVDSEERWGRLGEAAADDGTVSVAVLPGIDSAGYVRALSLGASGIAHSFLTSGLTVSVMFAALDGEVRMPRQAAFEMAVAAQGRTPAPTNLDSGELEMLSMLAGGMTVVELARQRFYNERTVRRHLQNIYLKLGVASRAEAIAKASSLGLID